jgi:glycosyltransferase involved in cell wall biosynthesis
MGEQQIAALTRSVTPMVATVVVCTHNRADFLAPLVAAVRNERLARRFELIIVDSASTDATPTVAAALATGDEPRVRAERLDRPGLCAARNRGLGIAAGSVVVFLDDDAIPRPGWLQAIVQPFEDPTVGAVGGPVSLRFSAPPPPWLTEPLRGYLTAYDLGPNPSEIQYTVGMQQFPRGANMAVRRSAAIEAGGFRMMFERRGRRLRSNDELDLCYRLQTRGWRLRYAPEAAVDHVVLAERLHPEWFLRRFSAQGTSDALFQLANRGLRRALGRLRWYYGPQLWRAPYRPGPDPNPVRFLSECERRAAWGYVAGLISGLPVAVIPLSALPSPSGIAKS